MQGDTEEKQIYKEIRGLRKGRERKDKKREERKKWKTR